MRHAGPEALARLEALLARIRRTGRFTEKKPGVFYLKGRAALHFHEHGPDLFADLRLSGADFERLQVDGDHGEALMSRLAGAADDGP